MPHQEAAWRQATFALNLSAAAPWNAMLEPPHRVSIGPEYYDAIYRCGAALADSDRNPFDLVLSYHRDSIVHSALVGDDCGNVTAFPAGVFGMNRLNHCPPIFEEYYRSGDERLRETALRWCDNYHDLSIWWGTRCAGEFGGTRYNNVRRSSDAHKDADGFMWRSNTAVSFCTKDYDSFFYAYEETGDPRMAAALRWQVAYAKESVHADRGECRNVGDVLDFVRLHHFTGRQDYLDEAMRLFRDLRTKLSTGDLFDQGGKPIEKDLPFLDDDRAGLRHGYAKPYIIGYVLAGLPALASRYPDEPKLRDVVRAVAAFLAESQDPLGGWRYPHPRSSEVNLSQAMEHARQLVQAAHLLGPEAPCLDAIENVLRQRILGWKKTGRILSGLDAWEVATGHVRERAQLASLYKLPTDRDFTRDYTEGSIAIGSSRPEGLVYFPEVLAYYLQCRPAERLLRLPHEDEPLGRVLNRLPDARR